MGRLVDVTNDTVRRSQGKKVPLKTIDKSSSKAIEEVIIASYLANPSEWCRHWFVGHANDRDRADACVTFDEEGCETFITIHQYTALRLLGDLQEVNQLCADLWNEGNGNWLPETTRVFRSAVKRYLGTRRYGKVINLPIPGRPYHSPFNEREEDIITWSTFYHPFHGEIKGSVQ